MDLRKDICEAHCRYFKPGREQDETCLGFEVLRKYLSSGGPRSLEHLKHRAGNIEQTTEKSLMELLCVSCPFYVDDCDFVRHVKDAPPCGGFIVAGLLLDAGALSIDNIRDIV